MLVLYKKIKATKEFTERKNLSLTRFESMFGESLWISVFWDTYNQVVWFSISYRIVSDIGFWWNIGSNWINVFVNFIFIPYQ